MARSNYIYIVYSCGGILDSAWTVKHEMISSLPETVEELKRKDINIFRLKDGGRIYDLSKSERPIDITDEIIKEYYE